MSAGFAGINAAVVPSTNAKTRVANVQDTVAGVNTWTDRAAANNPTLAAAQGMVLLRATRLSRRSTFVPWRR